MKKNLLTFCALFFLLPGCAYVEPLVQDFNIISVADETKIGQQAASEVAREMVIIEDPLLSAKVRSIGNRLVQALPRRDFDYHFYVVKEDSPNAFTIPGGSIYVHTGLLKFVEDDNELAGVMAHEIAHAFARHPVKGISRAYGAQYLSSLLFPGNQSQLKAFALKLTQGGLLTRYGREDELQADEIGYYLLKPAGFQTDGLLRFFGKLQNLESRGFSIPFLSSHPPTPERIARLQALERNSSYQPVLRRTNY